MLIATLPTIRSSAEIKLAEEIFSNNLVIGARYNTGGQTPLSANHILSELKVISDRFGKTLYVDLEGRQTRVAAWTPFTQKSVILNRDFRIELPAAIHFRRAGWCKIVNYDLTNRRVYFEPKTSPREYYLGEGQSVHVVAKEFEVAGYLGGRDFEFIQAAASLGVNNFMLSFVEQDQDVKDFLCEYKKCSSRKANLVLKIESVAGVRMIQSYPDIQSVRLMAARDDLFLGYYGRRGEILEALKTIIQIDSEAIVASRLLSGLERGSEVTLADISDVTLMKLLGYKHYMFADELSDNLDAVTRAWETQVLPNIRTMEE